MSNTINIGEQRYYPPHVSPGGMVTVTKVDRRWVSYALDGKAAGKMIKCMWLELAFAPPVPQPKRMADWIGLQVINRKPLTSGLHHFPAGTRFTVAGHHRGRLTLDTIFGPASITRVEQYHVEIMPAACALGRRARIRLGWQNQGKMCDVLGFTKWIGGMEWCAVLFDGDEDPDFFKLVGLEPA